MIIKLGTQLTPLRTAPTGIQLYLSTVVLSNRDKTTNLLVDRTQEIPPSKAKIMCLLDRIKEWRYFCRGVEPPNNPSGKKQLAESSFFRSAKRIPHFLAHEI